ncbi:MAG: VWA domain-containing protein, partial [Ignavibacteriales bacterium]
MAIFSFTHPQYLFFLILIPVFFFIHFFSLKNRKKIALKFANFNAIGRIQGIDFFSKNVVILVLNSVIILFMVFAVSGLNVQVSKAASSFAFVIAMDASGSMEADDFLPDRLAASREIASDFVDQSPIGTRIGVVSFSGNAYIEQDVSDDKVEIKNTLSNIKIKGIGGTDLYEAVITSSNLLYFEDHKAVILLSDGQINVGKIDEIIEYAQRNDVIIHSIAIGTKEGGKTPYSISKLDEESLMSLAYNTGGKYSLAENKADLSKSFLSVLDLTEKKVTIKITDYLVLLSIMLFSIEIFLVN